MVYLLNQGLQTYDDDSKRGINVISDNSFRNVLKLGLLRYMGIGSFVMFYMSAAVLALSIKK